MSKMLKPPADLLGTVWKVVAHAPSTMTAREVAETAEVRVACAEHKRSAVDALEWLRGDGFLRRLPAEAGRICYGVDAECKAPAGMTNPEALPVGELPIKAGPRTFVATQLPVMAQPSHLAPGREVWDTYPSRRGSRLYFKDGRITDLEGNPIGVTA